MLADRLSILRVASLAIRELFFGDILCIFRIQKAPLLRVRPVLPAQSRRFSDLAKNADAHMLEARSKELATLFETGEYTNWKTWADYAAQGAQMLTDIAGRVIGFRAGARALRGPQNATSRVDMPTIYGADGKPVARMIW